MNKELLIIRKVKPEDARDWYNLSTREWRNSYSHIFPEEVFKERELRAEKNIPLFTESMKNDNENISYVAEYDGKVIGIMYGTIKSTYKYFEDEYADLTILYIAKNYQGFGIGKQLRKAFEEWAKENGATKYVIGVLKDNEQARKVYEAWGGKLSSYTNDFIQLDVGYPEVFYTYDL